MGGTGIWLASLILPKTSMYRAVVSQSASGMNEAVMAQQNKSRLAGWAWRSPPCDRRKAQFGEEILDGSRRAKWCRGPGAHHRQQRAEALRKW
jgi:hypothetical protein